MRDDLSNARRRHERSRGQVDRRAMSAGSGGGSRAVRVFAKTAVPTTVPNTFATRPLGIAPPTGGEAEGAAPTLTPDTSSLLYVVVLGPRVPVAGDDLIAQYVPSLGRWVAESSSGGSTSGVTLPTCNCVVLPSTIAMTSLAPSCAGGLFQSCTLQYGPTPSCYSGLTIGSNAFLSTTTFTDGAGQVFQYYLNCQFAAITLSRVYCTSIYGSPFLDIVRYSWTIGAAGNVCSPMSMTNGSIYFGGDPTCNVQLSG